jgi:hypothetical protein
MCFVAVLHRFVTAMLQRREHSKAGGGQRTSPAVPKANATANLHPTSRIIVPSTRPCSPGRFNRWLRVDVCVRCTLSCATKNTQKSHFFFSHAPLASQTTMDHGELVSDALRAWFGVRVRAVA